MGRGILPTGALAITLVAVLFSGASAQSMGCTAAIVGLAPCMAYILGNTSAPASPCCTQLAGVVRSQPQCLCMVLNGGAAQLGLTLNQTRALALPSACNFQAPSVSLCNAVSGAPAASPAVSPQGAPAAPASPAAAPSEPSSPTPAAPSAPSAPGSSSPPTPSTPSVHSGNGSKRTEASAGSSTTMAVSPFLMLLFAASYTVL